MVEGSRRINHGVTRCPLPQRPGAPLNKERRSNGRPGQERQRQKRTAKKGEAQFEREAKGQERKEKINGNAQRSSLWQGSVNQWQRSATSRKHRTINNKKRSMHLSRCPMGRSSLRRSRSIRATGLRRSLLSVAIAAINLARQPRMLGRLQPVRDANIKPKCHQYSIDTVGHGRRQSFLHGHRWRFQSLGRAAFSIFGIADCV